MKPTEEQSKALAASFAYLNETLFANTLTPPMLIFSRNKNVIGGYFAPHKWENEDGVKVHEIAINANIMEADIVELLGVLVHEMCHLWQQDFGKPSRAGYHNQEWADKMVEIGLQPFGPDGKPTGQSISHKAIEGGKFLQEIMEFPEEAVFPWRASAMDIDPPSGSGSGGEGKEGKESDKEEVKESKAGKRTKYTCPVCGLNAWAKAGARMICGDCDMELIEMQKGGKINGACEL